MNTYILPYHKITQEFLPIVGGKNAFLGEMVTEMDKTGIRIPPGYAVKANAYQDYLKYNYFDKHLVNILAKLDVKQFSNLEEIGERARELLRSGVLPYHLQIAILAGYENLKEELDDHVQVAVRSSTVEESFTVVHFARQQETYLNISKPDQLIAACQQCFTSLFTNDAIKYRVDRNLDHLKMGLSIGVQSMVRADKASSGLAFSVDPKSKNRESIIIRASWGFGKNLLYGKVDPDEYKVAKAELKNGTKAIQSRKIGKKQFWLKTVDDTQMNSLETTVNQITPEAKRNEVVLNDREIIKLAKWCNTIETHYQYPMDIEWAKDGFTDELFIVQARPSRRWIASGVA